MKLKLKLTFLLSCTLALTYGQIRENGRPLSWEQVSVKTTRQTFQPAQKFNNDSLAATIDKNSGSYHFARSFEVNKNSEEHGNWRTLDDGSRIWEYAIASEGAYALNVSFSNYDIPPGAKVYIYNSDKSQLLGAFTEKNNKKYGSLSTAPVAGDQIIIEYNEPADVPYSGYLRIGTVGHAFLDIFHKDTDGYGDSGACNIDINCALGDDWQTVKRGIVRIIFPSGDGWYYCTGSLINNTKNDGTPYFLTANHCISRDAEAQGAIFYFNYESPSCSGGNGSEQQTISGASILATTTGTTDLDYTLLYLDEEVPASYEPYFVGWDSRGNTPAEAYCIHHPQGDVKKISKTTDITAEETYSYEYLSKSFYEVYWSEGTTEGGSSGSPLFDENQRLIGTLTGGAAACGVSGPDYYQMLDYPYDYMTAADAQLAHWLDSEDTGISYLDGYDIFGSITNVSDSSGANLYVIADQNGYMSGNNSSGDLRKAEFFAKDSLKNKNAIVNVQVRFGYATGHVDSLITVEIYSEKDGYPDTVMASSTQSLGSIIDEVNSWTSFAFDTVLVDTNFFVSVVLPTAAGDTVAVLLSDTVSNSLNTAWEMEADGSWKPYTETWGFGAAHFIQVDVVGMDTAQSPDTATSIIAKESLSKDITIYPNPANDYLNIYLLNGMKDCAVYAYNLMGRQMYNGSIYRDKQIDISSWAPGVYLLKVVQGNQQMTVKVLKE